MYHAERDRRLNEVGKEAGQRLAAARKDLIEVTKGYEAASEGMAELARTCDAVCAEIEESRDQLEARQRSLEDGSSVMLMRYATLPLHACADWRSRLLGY